MTPAVILSGLPGSMATEAMNAIREQPDMTLADYGLTGPSRKELQYNGVTLIYPSDHPGCLRELRRAHESLVAVDFSRASIERQAELYANAGVPFVYGGTIGDREEAEKIIRGSSVSAVIAPNMSKQLVAWTAALEYMAREFPGAFSDYQGHVTESHQSTKRDPSGTGRAWMQVLTKLGITFGDMESIRDPTRQRNIGVPEGALGSHAYHWVYLSGSTGMGFYTKVNGRRTYADGAVDAIRYISRKMHEDSHGMIFSMIDVLRGT